MFVLILGLKRNLLLSHNNYLSFPKNLVKPLVCWFWNGHTNKWHAIFLLFLRWQDTFEWLWMSCFSIRTLLFWKGKPYSWILSNTDCFSIEQFEPSMPVLWKNFWICSLNINCCPLSHKPEVTLIWHFLFISWYVIKIKTPKLNSWPPEMTLNVKFERSMLKVFIE